MVKICTFTYNNLIIMVSNKNFEVVILSDEEAKVELLKGLLSKYYSSSLTLMILYSEISPIIAYFITILSPADCE